MIQPLNSGANGTHNSCGFASGMNCNLHSAVGELLIWQIDSGRWFNVQSAHPDIVYNANNIGGHRASEEIQHQLATESRCSSKERTRRGIVDDDNGTGVSAVTILHVTPRSQSDLHRLEISGEH